MLLSGSTRAPLGSGTRPKPDPPDPKSFAIVLSMQLDDFPGAKFVAFNIAVPLSAELPGVPLLPVLRLAYTHEPPMMGFGTNAPPAEGVQLCNAAASAYAVPGGLPHPSLMIPFRIAAVKVLACWEMDFTWRSPS